MLEAPKLPRLQKKNSSGRWNESCAFRGLILKFEIPFECLVCLFRETQNRASLLFTIPLVLEFANLRPKIEVEAKLDGWIDK